MKKMFTLIIYYFTTCICGVVSIVVTRQCLQCICQASTNCNVNVGCISKLDNIYCGPYQISSAYWMAADAIDVYNRCTNEMQCSQKIVINYMNKYANDCDKNGQIDCIDFASIHYMGNACNNMSYLQTTSFWSEFKKTTCYYDNFIAYEARAQEEEALSSEAKNKNSRYLNFFRLNMFTFFLSSAKNKKSLLFTLFDKSPRNIGYNSNNGNLTRSASFMSTNTSLQLLPRSSLNYNSSEIREKVNHSYLFNNNDNNCNSNVINNNNNNHINNNHIHNHNNANNFLNEYATEAKETIINTTNENRMNQSNNNNIDYKETIAANISSECLSCIHEIINDQEEDIPIKPYQYQEIMHTNNNFIQCKTNNSCAYDILRYYIGKYYRDCNHDGYIDCDDYTLIYLLGSDCEDKQIYNTSLWRHFEYCTIMSDKARREKYITSSDKINESSGTQEIKLTDSPVHGTISVYNLTNILSSSKWPSLLESKRLITSTRKSYIPSAESNSSYSNNQLNILQSQFKKSTQSNAMFSVTQTCIECIYEASSGNINTANETACNDGPCGPFQITKDYWLNCGSPGNTGAPQYEDFDKCANDFDCSNQCVHSYISSSITDCNNDGNIDCLDFTIIHRLGQQSCEQSALIEQLFETNYWRSFEACYGFN